MPLQNECLTGHSAEWAGPEVLAGHNAEWATPYVLTGHNADSAGKQVAVKQQWCMTPSCFFSCSRLEGPNFRNKEEFCCYSASLILRNSVRNGEGKLLGNTTYDVLEQASEI